MFKCSISDKTVDKLDHAIELVCDEMETLDTWKVTALAKVLRDLVVARAVLTEVTDVLSQF